MAGPAKAGLLIYACDTERIAHFYQEILGMRRLHEREDLIVMQSDDIQLLIHQIPAHIAANIVILSPPKRREDTALKFFFTVPSLSQASLAAAELGGQVFDESWEGPGFTVCNAMDPEGNVFQVRELVSGEQ